MNVDEMYFQPIGMHVTAIRGNVNKLQAFADKYPTLKPAHVSAYVPSITLSSTYVDICRKLFGAEGWKQQGMVVKKIVDGVEIELHLPRTEKKEVML